MARTMTRRERLARAERVAQGPIRVRWDRVGGLVLALVSMAVTFGMFWWMGNMFLDGAM